MPLATKSGFGMNEEKVFRILLTIQLQDFKPPVQKSAVNVEISADKQIEALHILSLSSVS